MSLVCHKTEKKYSKMVIFKKIYSSENSVFIRDNLKAFIFYHCACAESAKYRDFKENVQ